MKEKSSRRQFAMAGSLALVVGAMPAACAHKAAGGEAGGAAPAGGNSSSSSSADGGSAGSQGPHFVAGDVRKLYERELAPLPVTKIHAGKLSGEVEGAGPPKIESDDRSIRISFSIGTGSDVQCFVYPEPIDVGAQLLHIVKAIEGVDVQLLRPDVAVIGDRVAVFLEVQYLAKTAQGVGGGELKTVAYDHPTTPLVCLHDEVGYNASFRRITTGLAASLKVEDKELKIPKFVEIYEESINGQPAGFSRAALLPAEKGNSLFVETHASVIPRTPKDLYVEDSMRMTTIDSSGRVAEMRYSEGTGGEQTENLQLKRLGAHEYSYAGTHRGKNISGKLKTKDPRGFPTEADTIRNTLKLFGAKSAEPELRVEEYHPDLDPTAPVEYVIRATSKSERKVTLTLSQSHGADGQSGDLQLTGTVDSEGHLISADRPVGAAKLSIRRVFSRGSL